MHKLLWLAAALTAPVHASECLARSGAQAPTLVELYTSQGCSSCPPAERWLRELPRDGSVLPLAFHVSYWDYLGWRDPLARPEHGERQRQQMRINGSRIAYTPQLVVQGRDRRDWPQWQPASAGAAPLQIELRRVGAGAEAVLRSERARPLSAQWWWTSSGHDTQVAAGENRGSRLRHDHVVRGGQALPPFQLAAATPLRLVLAQAPAGMALTLVLLEDGRPLQALRLDC